MAMRLAVLTALWSAGLALTGVQSPQVFRSSVDLVPVFATATTADGAFARDLTKEDFVVLDNDKPQNIVSFSSEAQALSVSVIMDTSASMQSALPRVFGAARAFIDRLTPEDRVMIGSLYYVGPAISSDKTRLRTSLDLLPRDPGSPVFAALDRSVAALRPETNRRVIVIYTDGRNVDVSRFGKTSAHQLLERVEQSGVMVYAIGFEGVSISSDMKKIAAHSGGRATELQTTDDLGRALTGVADELHHQYLLGFTPAAFDGKVHRLEVRVKRPGLSVRARQSYVARSRE